MQNLPRTYLDHQAEWRSIVKLHDPEALALLTDNVSDTLSQLIRTALVPGKGCTFVDADFSAIEARLIRARQEYQEADFYDYLIINDDADKAAKELSAIILAEHCRFHDRLEYLK